MTASKIEEVIADFLKWGKEDPNAFKISQYRRARGYPKSTWYFWVEKFPDFKRANIIVKEDIASNRELGVGGVYERRLDHSMLKMMYRYDPDWDEMELRAAHLKAIKEEDKKQNITIVIPDIREKDNESDTNKLPDKTGSDPKVKQIQGA